MKQELLKLREIFRQWYGELTETEITTNQPLIRLIELIEACFQSLGGEFS